jgi:hypothetical protein
LSKHKVITNFAHKITRPKTEADIMTKVSKQGRVAMEKQIKRIAASSAHNMAWVVKMSLGFKERSWKWDGIFWAHPHQEIL